MSKILKTAAASIVGIAMITGTSAGAADKAADFYKGRTVTLLVAFGAGGGFGLYSRILAEHMGQYVPGHPTIQPQFMPGAGGLKAANYLFNVSPHDGSVFAILSQTGALSQRVERGRRGNKIKYDLARMNWLGRLVTMEAGVVGRVGSGLTSVDAVHNSKSVVACSNGKTHQGYINAKSIAESLGFPIKIVIGYPGSKDMLLALERGECNFLPLSLSTWETRGKYMITKKIVKPLMVVSTERSPFWPTVPTTVELAKDKAAKQVLEFIARYAAIGRAYGLPPGTPGHLVKAMQKAFVDTYKDPEFAAIFKKRKIPFNPAPGSVVEQNVKATLAASDSLVAKTRHMLGWDGTGS